VIHTEASNIIVEDTEETIHGEKPVKRGLVRGVLICANMTHEEGGKAISDKYVDYKISWEEDGEEGGYRVLCPRNIEEIVDRILYDTYICAKIKRDGMSINILKLVNTKLSGIASAESNRIYISIPKNVHRALLKGQKRDVREKKIPAWIKAFIIVVWNEFKHLDNVDGGFPTDIEIETIYTCIYDDDYYKER